MTPTVDRASLAQVQFRQPQFLIAAAMLNPEDGRSLLSCLLALAFSPLLLQRRSLSQRRWRKQSYLGRSIQLLLITWES